MDKENMNQEGTQEREKLDNSEGLTGLEGMTPYEAPSLNITGKQLLNQTQDTFDTQDVTPEQLAYVMDMQKPSSYMLRNHSIKGNPFTFSVSGRDTDRARSHRPWQKDIIDNPSKDLAVMKSRQLGLSEISVGKMLHFVDTHSADRVKGLFAFPTNRHMDDFAKTRIDPLLNSGYYSTLINKENNSMKVKQIRDSFLYFRSSSTPGALEGVDNDYLALDEFDHVSASAESSALESLSSSKYGITNRWSTPTVPNYGIHRLFEQGTQNHYMHKCDRCNYWNKMTYADYDSSDLENSGNIKLVNTDGINKLAKTVSPSAYEFVCQRCGKPLDRWYSGEWVSKFPSRSLESFFITQMNAVWFSASDLKDKEIKARSKQTFYNYTLGYPYEDTKLQVTAEDITKHTYDSLNWKQKREDDHRFVSMGIDWGSPNWVTIMGVKDNGVSENLNNFIVETPKINDPAGIGSDIAKIQMLIDQYNPDIIVADVGDSGDRVAKLIDMYGDKVWGCRYNSSPRSNQQFKPSWSESNSTVKVDKLTENKKFINLMKQGQILFPKNKDDEILRLYIEHWLNVSIRLEEDEKTGEFYQIITRIGDD